MIHKLQHKWHRTETIKSWFFVKQPLIATSSFDIHVFKGGNVYSLIWKSLLWALLISRFNQGVVTNVAPIMCLTLGVWNSWPMVKATCKNVWNACYFSVICYNYFWPTLNKWKNRSWILLVPSTYIHTYIHTYIPTYIHT